MHLILHVVVIQLVYPFLSWCRCFPTYYMDGPRLLGVPVSAVLFPSLPACPPGHLSFYPLFLGHFVPMANLDVEAFSWTLCFLSP